MSDHFSYRDYVEDERFLEEYNAYQRRYAGDIRESDKALIEMVQALAQQMPPDRRPLRLLDIGCSTGNLLLHLSRQVPGLALTGGDLALSSLEECRRNPELAGIAFEELNLLDLPRSQPWDVVVVNAVLYMLDDDQFEAAARSLHGALRPGGSLLAFDFAHAFEQSLSILERSRTHPEGLALHFRPMTWIQRCLSAAGFAEVTFRPFAMPFDLARPDDPADIGTYTLRREDGERLSFRGTLFQPWCHLKAQRA